MVEISEDGTSKLLPNYTKYKSTSSNLEDKVTYIFSKNADYDHPDGKTKHDIESIKECALIHGRHCNRDDKLSLAQLS